MHARLELHYLNLCLLCLAHQLCRCHYHLLFVRNEHPGNPDLHWHLELDAFPTGSWTQCLCRRACSRGWGTCMHADLLKPGGFHVMDDGLLRSTPKQHSVWCDSTTWQMNRGERNYKRPCRWGWTHDFWTDSSSAWDQLSASVVLRSHPFMLQPEVRGPDPTKVSKRGSPTQEAGEWEVSLGSSPWRLAAWPPAWLGWLSQKMFMKSKVERNLRAS